MEAEKIRRAMQMNAILSILVCLAMLFSGGAALPAQPEKQSKSKTNRMKQVHFFTGHPPFEKATVLFFCFQLTIYRVRRQGTRGLFYVEWKSSAPK